MTPTSGKVRCVQVQAWMGHAHVQTTACHLHAKSQADDAALLASAFALDSPSWRDGAHDPAAA